MEGVKMKNFCILFFIALLIGMGLGYWWSWSALTKTYETRLEEKDKIIRHYRATWSPIRDFKQAPVRHRLK
jgi:hypothetical protein